MPDHTAAAETSGGQRSSSGSTLLSHHVSGALNRFHRFITIRVPTVRKLSSTMAVLQLTRRCPLESTTH